MYIFTLISLKSNIHAFCASGNGGIHLQLMFVVLFLDPSFETCIAIRSVMAYFDTECIAIERTSVLSHTIVHVASVIFEHLYQGLSLIL